MSQRRVQGTVKAVREDISDLRTQRAMPVPGLDILDPFLFLNHHGPQTYQPFNRGLPFGPHPHRGFETLTIILEGDILHRDSSGAESVIGEGGIQWMRAGRGIVHSEESSPDFKRDGGPLEILQLWMNLPAKSKMTDPQYLGLQKSQIPTYRDAGIEVQVYSGKFKDLKGPVETVTDPTILLLELDGTRSEEIDIPEAQSVFFYVIQGSGKVNGEPTHQFQTVVFANEGERIKIDPESKMKILLCFAAPIGEPVVSYGPFVMNTREEVSQAISDFQNGRF